MFDVTHLIQTGGLLLIGLIIFAESGMMVGFFLPGDTLLLSAGVLAAGGKLPLAGVLLVTTLAAILGDNTGYHIGRHLGPRLFRKSDGVIFRKEYIDQAETFYKKHGSKTMLLAHFVPIVRCFVPVTAGAAKMKYGQFFLFDGIGDAAWAVSITLLGYYVASRIPGIEHYIDPALVLIVIMFLTPALWHLARDQKIRTALKAKFSKS